MAAERRSSLIKGEHIRTADATVVLGKSPSTTGQKPIVKITKQEGSIHEIVVECPCGNVVRLECQYPKDL